MFPTHSSCLTSIHSGLDCTEIEWTALLKPTVSWCAGLLLNSFHEMSSKMCSINEHVCVPTVATCAKINYLEVSVLDNRCLCVFPALSRMNSAVKCSENNQKAIVSKENTAS